MAGTRVQQGAVEQARPRAVFMRGALRWRYAIPPEKGGWVWLAGPLLVGLAAGGTPGVAALAVIVAAFCAYCVRQPITLLLRIWFRSRNPEDAAPALFWAAAHGIILAACLAYLVVSGAWVIVALGLLGAPVLAAQLYFVARGADRHQYALEILATFALSLGAPAVYLAGGGADYRAAVVLWFLCGMQSAASVVHMFVRLEQRRLREMPPLGTRLAAGMQPLLAHGAALVFAAAFAILGEAPLLAAAGLAIAFAEGMWAVLRPQVGHKPKQLGMRQLAVSSAFFLLFAIGVLLRG